jgi:hypothetical protein
MINREVIGIIAGIISLIATLPYIISILKRKTKPSRTTWSVWSILSIVIAINYIQVGGGSAVWVYIGYAFGVTVIGLLSFRYGEGGWTIMDKICLGGVMLSLIIWWYSGSALLSLFSILTVDIFGAIPTILKAYKKPEEEDKIAWALGFSANLLNLFAIQVWTFSLVIYPIYLFTMTGLVTLLTVLPRTKSVETAQI